MSALTLEMIGAGVPMLYIAMLVGLGAGAALLFALAQPYQMARLTTFLPPWSTNRSRPLHRSRRRRRRR